MWGALVLSRRGLRRGARSRSFALRDLDDAARAPAAEHVFVDVDAEGRLTARGGVARAVRAARLADAAPHATALLCALPAPAAPAAPADDEPRLQLRLAADAAPLHELRLWFDEHTLALLDMPFLTLRNIAGRQSYVCHVCGASFEQPNPLKLHMFLACAPPDPAAFWSRCAARLRARAAPPAAPAAPAALDPARLEALAAAWGRARAGHVCVYCGKLYSRRYGLKIHIRTHTGYKPLRCRHCLRAFGDPSNLNKHVRLHAAAAPGAPHACALCRKPLARRRDLLRHLRTHHAHADEHA